MIKKLLNWFTPMGKNVIIIDGVRTEVSGNNIVIRNGTLTVDGVRIKDGLMGEVNIKWEGDLANLNSTSAVIHGSVHGDVDGTNITVNGNIDGDVDGINITAREIKGNVDAVNVTRK